MLKSAKIPLKIGPVFFWLNLKAEAVIKVAVTNYLLLIESNIAESICILLFIHFYICAQTEKCKSH